MKTIRKILRTRRLARKNRTFSNFISLIFGYTFGNPKLTEDQEQLLNFWLSKIRDTKDMTIHTAVSIARWINTEVTGFKGAIECDFFEKVPA